MSLIPAAGSPFLTEPRLHLWATTQGDSGEHWGRHGHLDPWVQPPAPPPFLPSARAALDKKDALCLGANKTPPHFRSRWSRLAWAWAPPFWGSDDVPAPGSVLVPKWGCAAHRVGTVTHPSRKTQPGHLRPPHPQHAQCSCTFLPQRRWRPHLSRRPLRVSTSKDVPQEPEEEQGSGPPPRHVGALAEPGPGLRGSGRPPPSTLLASHVYRGRHRHWERLCCPAQSTCHTRCARRTESTQAGVCADGQMV